MEGNGFKFQIATTKSENRKAPLRWFFWKDCLEIIQDKPIWGHGYLSFFPYIQSFNPTRSGMKGHWEWKMHTMNMFL